jgi:hypothetical protein
LANALEVRARARACVCLCVCVYVCVRERERECESVCASYIMLHASHARHTWHGTHGAHGTRTCTHVYTHAHTRTRPYARTHSHARIYAYTHTHTRHIHTHTHTRTHTHTHTGLLRHHVPRIQRQLLLGLGARDDRGECAPHALLVRSANTRALLPVRTHTRCYPCERTRASYENVHALLVRTRMRCKCEHTRAACANMCEYEVGIVF